MTTFRIAAMTGQCHYAVDQNGMKLCRRFTNRTQAIVWLVRRWNARELSGSIVVYPESLSDAMRHDFATFPRKIAGKWADTHANE